MPLTSEPDSAQVIEAVRNTISSRYFTYTHTMTQPSCDTSAFTFRETGYVDLVGQHVDALTVTDPGSETPPDSEPAADESCSPAPVRMMLEGTIVHLHLPGDEWDTIPFPGIGASSLAPLFWLLGTQEAQPNTNTPSCIDVSIDLSTVCARSPQWARDSLDIGLEHLFSRDTATPATGRIHITDGLVHSAVLTLPPRRDPVTSESLPESTITLQLVPSTAQALPFPSLS